MKKGVGHMCGVSSFYFTAPIFTMGWNGLGRSILKIGQFQFPNTSLHHFNFQFDV